MKLRLTGSVLGGFIALVGATMGCGSSSSGGAGGHGGGAAGHGDGSADAATAGADGAAGAGGAGAGGAGGTAAAGAGGAATAGAGVDAALDGATDGGADAPAEAAPSDGANDGAGEAPALIDAGFDCIAPTGEAALSAATEGLPATGLALWLRGDRGVYKTSAATVCAWADQSGHPWLMTNGATRPLWEATGLGGKPAIHFRAAGQELGTSGVIGIAPTSARTFVVVSILVNTTQRFQSVLQGQSGTPGTYVGVDANTWLTTGSKEGVYVSNNSLETTLATAAVPRIHVFTITTMALGTPVLPALDYRVNGATQTLTRTPGSAVTETFQDFSGANFTVVGTLTEGIIAEVLVYDRALTVDERGAVETALKTRYGIQ